MLELRPTCEHCNKPLPPNASDAMICSFECTFCQTCVDSVIENVCPNCGGGFTRRPVRPTQDRQGGNTLDKYPASTKVKHRPVNVLAHRELIAAVGKIAPIDR